MVTRKRKVIAMVGLVLLAAGAAVFLFTRDSGPPVVVHGDLSEKDVAQIKSAVKRELWKEAVPNFSWATLKALPRSVRWALKVRLRSISGPSTVNGTTEARVGLEGPNKPGGLILISPHGFIVTNGPNGWAVSRKFVYE
jgi:hypothetical protein